MLLQANSRRLLIIATILLLVVSSIVTTVFFESSKEGLLGQRLHSQHELLGIAEDDVVFIGDDLTAEALWSELFPELSVRNRGMNGQTTEEMLLRLPNIAQARPRIVLINSGASDLEALKPPAQIIANMREAVNLLQSFSPASRLIIVGVLPTSTESMVATDELNHSLRQLSQTHALEFIDLSSALLDGNGRFMEGLADRRSRLHGAGYAKWRDLLKPHLVNL
ncbi:MAG: GDSL-type esterase/lipase family protein [Pseudomonadales bacterium]